MHFIGSLLIILILGISSGHAGSIERASAGDLQPSAICIDDADEIAASASGQPDSRAGATLLMAEAATTVGPQEVAQKCCKTCRKGKACGNSYIAMHLTCRQPPGCACNG